MSATPYPFELEFPQHPCHDPVIRVSPIQQSYSLLFDCGDLRHLSHSQIVHSPYICVSHTHVDHFIGFDQIIRHAINRSSPIYVYGPQGLAVQVQHRLLGYSWNLLQPDQIQYYVTELSKDGAVKKFHLVNHQQFTPKLIEERNQQSGLAPVADLDLLPGELRLQGVVLDHDIEVVAYRLQYPRQYHVDVERLQKLALPAGPWINDLKQAMARDDGAAKITVAPGLTKTAGDLGREILIGPTERSFGYLTDLAFHDDNRQRAQKLFQGVTVLACETSFLLQDEVRARQRLHLTTRDAAQIAAEAGAQELRPFHVSRVYKDRAESVTTEALGFFKKFQHH